MSSQGGSERTLQSLIGELNGVGRSDSSSDPAVRTEAVIQDASGSLFDDGTPTIDDGLVKESLPELLMMLVGLRDGDTHGKGVMEDLNRFFGAQLSPGTVYPMLHDLEEEGFLEMRELVQTKEYAIDDGDAVRNELHEAMTQHLALGMVFHRALDEFDAADD
ncbi:PadR family transcriptional regulator [Natronomonas amylolytica]|uniref:PadR family transcriptional regulator n=1 Tax=Natronomonas amylolytica TaxID=3108498 RepID=UPI00300A59E8